MSEATSPLNDAGSISWVRAAKASIRSLMPTRVTKRKYVSRSVTVVANNSSVRSSRTRRSVSSSTDRITTAAAFYMAKHLRLGLVGNLRRIGAVGKAKGHRADVEVRRDRSIGTFTHGFSATGRQLTNTIRAPSLAALRICAKAATGSPKNITPKFDTSKSYPLSAAVAGSASCLSTLAMPAPSARDLRPLPLHLRCQDAASMHRREHPQRF